MTEVEVKRPSLTNFCEPKDEDTGACSSILSP